MSLEGFCKPVVVLNVARIWRISGLTPYLRPSTQSRTPHKRSATRTLIRASLRGGPNIGSVLPCLYDTDMA